MRTAYDALAPDYDAFTAGYAHERWFAALHRRARQFGLRGERALDLACGTGKSTRLLVDAGYRVRGCDISPGMIEVARSSLPELADELFVADMRALPEIGEVDFVLCLDDAINYVLDPAELVETFRGVRRALRPGGVFVFDTNTLATFRSSFSEIFVRRGRDHFFAWQGRGDGEMTPGGLGIAEIDAFSANPDGSWRRATSRHEQRHHPRSVIVESLRAAGLECCGIDGQRRGAILEPAPDECAHIKFVYYSRAD